MHHPCIVVKTPTPCPPPLLKVAIPGRPEDTGNYECAVRQAGALCQVIRDTTCLNDFDALLLPGGGDIDPVLYGRTNCGSRHIDLELDLLQLKAADHFLCCKKPILGICKGLQILHVALGGRICQDIPEAPAHAWKEGDQYHPTSLLPDSVLARLFSVTSLTVNSAHHQSIIPGTNGLQIIQSAEDGIPEGVIHESLPVIGFQWHPERMPCQLPDHVPPQPSAVGAAIFQYFLSLCRCSDR